MWRQIVEALAFGVVTVGDDGTVAFANEAAAAMLDADLALSVDRGRVAIRPLHTQHRFLAWLREPAEGSRPPFAIARADGRLPFVADYLFGVFVGEVGRCHVLALLASDAPPAVDARRLASAFGLTRAEAALVASLAAGETLQEFAQRQQVSVATARTHLENVFAKTGARRQAQLVRLALACFLPLAPFASSAALTGLPATASATRNGGRHRNPCFGGVEGSDEGAPNRSPVGVEGGRNGPGSE